MVEEILDKGLCEFEPIRTKEIGHKNMVYTHITTSKESCKGTKAFIVADLETILVKNTHTPFAAVSPKLFIQDLSLDGLDPPRNSAVNFSSHHKPRLEFYMYLIFRDDCCHYTDSVVFGNPLNEEDLSPTELGVHEDPTSPPFLVAREIKKGEKAIKSKDQKIKDQSKLLAASRSSRMLDLDGESPVAENTTSLRPYSSSIGGRRLPKAGKKAPLKVAKFPVGKAPNSTKGLMIRAQSQRKIDVSVKMRTTCTERPYEASLFLGIGFSSSYEE
ncbi:hypothetical protein Tco_0231117 [Tanacetum coccineum]